MRILPMTRADVRDGLQVQQWLLFLIGAVVTTLPAFLLMIAFGFFTTRYKIVKSHDPSAIDGAACIMAGLVGGALIWMAAALMLSAK
jgi:chromate transport protein ChrA